MSFFEDVIPFDWYIVRKALSYKIIKVFILWTTLPLTKFYYTSKMYVFNDGENRLIAGKPKDADQSAESIELSSR